MPKYQCSNEPMGIIEWCICLVLLGFLLALIISLAISDPWALPCILGFIFFILLISKWLTQKTIKSFALLAERRKNDSICSFARHFDCRKVDPWVIRAVYEQLQERTDEYYPGFPIHPLDSVFEDLELDDEDFEEDVVGEIAHRTGRSLENAEENPYFGKANIVENLVYFFNLQPKTKVNI